MAPLTGDKELVMVERKLIGQIHQTRMLAEGGLRIITAILSH